MQLSLALAYKSDSEDPSGISKRCGGVFFGGRGGTFFVIRLWTASCSNQLDEIDFFFFFLRPPPAAGGLSKLFPGTFSEAVNLKEWRLLLLTPVGGSGEQTSVVNLTLHQAADGAAHPRVPLLPPREKLSLEHLHSVFFFVPFY